MGTSSSSITSFILTSPIGRLVNVIGPYRELPGGALGVLFWLQRLLAYDRNLPQGSNYMWSSINTNLATISG